MGLPDKRPPNQPTKRHPACPGKSRCKLASCIHNAPRSNFSTDHGISFDLYEVNGFVGAYPSIGFSGGWLYQRLDAVSGGTDVREIGGVAKTTIGTMMYATQTKIREMSGIILDGVRSRLNAEMAV